MMSSCPFSVNGELGQVGIALLNSLTSPQVSVGLAKWLDIILKQRVLLSLLASLKLLDVVHVGPSHDRKSRQQEDQPAIALVVEAIGLPPVWEYANILVSIVRLVSGLQAVTRELGVDILLRNIRKCRVSASMRVRVLKRAVTTAASKDSDRG